MKSYPDSQNRTEKPANWRSAARGNAFTLIELLIVIVIISILAAMLLPALKNARDMAKRSVCAGNMKQLGLTIGMYINDYSYYLPGQTNGGAYDSVKWSTSLFDGNYVPMNQELFKCPDDQVKYYSFDNSYFYNYASNAGDYATQNAGLHERYTPFRIRRDSEVTRPTTAVLLVEGDIDSGQAWEAVATSKFATPGFIYPGTVSPSPPKIRLRHNLGGDFLFCDGHIDYLKPNFPLTLFTVKN